MSSLLGRKLGLHPHPAFIRDLKQNAARLHDFADNEIVLDDRTVLRCQKIKHSGRFRSVTDFDQSLYLLRCHAERQELGACLLGSHLRFHITPLGNDLTPQLAHAAPFARGNDQVSLRIRHLDAGQGDKRLSGRHMVPKPCLPGDNLSGNSRGDLR
ncbi:hypothetical protein JCM17843_31010 [Kordiimonadales bacterium JCM 17843]|nr:hypothetical protein JCM17843_31010 [Kordiimonadales bacterium JCM 17843]